MRKQKPQRERRVPKPKFSSDEISLKQSRKGTTFTEIGGSPVPGLTLRHVLRGHTDFIGRIAWTPDGSYIASPSGDKTIRIWDTRTGTCVRTLEGHAEAVTSLAWSPDGQRLASASDDYTIRLWQAVSGKSLEGHTDRITTVAWSPDDHYLASASYDKTIRLWEAATGELLQILKGHSDVVNIVAWSPDGQYLASASDDHSIRLWHTSSARPLQTLKGHSGSVCGTVWLPDGQHLVSAAYDKTIRVWDVATGKALQVLEGHAGFVNGVDSFATGRWLASKSVGEDLDVGLEDTIRLWYCDTWACVAVLDEPASGVWYSTLAFHPRLPMLATLGEEDTIIRIWELDEEILLNQAQESVHYTTAKLVLVGDSGVGKTGLGWRLAHDEFKEHASTHGQQFWPIQRLGTKRKDGTECEAVLWDLAGQHVYRQIHSIFLENVAAALVLFDPSNRQEPLKGVQFWLEQLKGKGQLPPTVLIGARIDRGAPAVSQQELDQFCQRYGIRGGYISTSALKGDGLDALLETLKAQIPWDEMTTTVTTVTFKRIKDHVLALKEKPNRKGVLVSPRALRNNLKQPIKPGVSPTLR